MNALLKKALLLTFLVLTAAAGNELLFQDDFAGRLGEGWSWLREHKEAWRLGERSLEVRIEPGNMWGPANNARNVLLRDAPDPTESGVEVSVQVQNRPTEQYEQVDLVWYYRDSHMVKLGQELVDGKLSIVMGREENDRTRTIAIIPLDSSSVHLRLRVKGRQIWGAFRTTPTAEWKEAGSCDLPQPENARPKISLQFYQGPAAAEHWAQISEFRVRKLSP